MRIDNPAIGSATATTQSSSDNSTYVATTAFVTTAVGGSVTSITGTAHEIIASASTGAITLSTPQGIDTTSSPTFAALTLTSPLTLANGGSSAALTASLGGIVYSTASAMAILSGTATANQVLLSGASGAPAWSTATYPATTTVSQILYSSSANVIAGLATANSSVLVTNGSGVPSLSTALPNGTTATTQASSDSSTKIATTAFVATAVSGGVTPAINATLDGGGGVVQAYSSTNPSTYTDITIPQEITITGWYLRADQSGSINFDIQTAAFGTTPNTSIVGGNYPSLSSAQTNSSTTLTGWTTTINAGTTIRFMPNGTPATCLLATLTIYGTIN